MRTAIQIILFVAVTYQLTGQSKNFIDQPYIETIVRIDTSVIPDIITLSIFISESDTKKNQSIGELEEQMLRSLTSIGIDINEQLALTDLSSNFSKYFLRKKDVEKTKSYLLRVKTAREAGDVITALAEIKISNIEIEKIEIENEEMLLLELKKMAVIKAQKKANLLANAIGQKVGRALYITDIYSEPLGGPQEIMVRSRVEGLIWQEFGSSSIEFEKIDLVNEVMVKFALE